MLRLRFLTLFVVACSLTSLAQAEFKVGVGKAIITPDPLLPVSGGVGPGRPSTGKQGELTARAMVFQQGETKVAIVQLDLLGFPSILCARVHKQVPRIPADNILIGSTHTHSAPDCYGFPGLNGKTSGNLEYMDFVCNQAAIAINQALDNLQPAALKIATGEAKGKIAYNYYAPELYDPRMSVIQAITPDGKTIGTLVNYAVHPEVLGNGVGLVSPDLVGPLCDQLEADLGGMGMFMNGAQGGMITADNRRLENPSDPLKAKWHDSRTWEECVRIGHLMATEAQRIVKEASPQTEPKLACYSEQVKFPVASDLMWMIIRASPLKYPHNDDKSITTRMNLVNLGNAQILTIPGEALPNIGYYIKRHMKGENNLLFGLTNDAFGYILTKVDFNSFKRYEYISQTSLGEMTGEVLIENALKLIGNSPAPTTAASSTPSGSPAAKVAAIKVAAADAWRGLDRQEIQLDQKLLVVKGSKGVIGCPYLNIGSFEKFGEACAIIPAVDTAGMLDSKVTAVTTKAKELGIELGMSGREALDRIR